MKNLHIALAVIAALMAGSLATAEARDRRDGHGAQKQRHAGVQHRAAPRGFQKSVDRRQARQRARIREGAASGRLNHRELARLGSGQKQIRAMERRFGADGRYDRAERRILNHALDRSSKRIWRMKGNGHGRPGVHGSRFRIPHGLRWQHRFRGHRARRHLDHVYPVYDDRPAHSLGLDIETPDFRFSVNKSG